ncbi:NlpC/P60 family protein [Actinopolymorpha pittospori]|uniref:Cell wall-associated NlpC family hydrolase n=1 Tax=Actinopolymorpha pittospori TaxID=648752 RepID=A0A927N114_9ACTN|nr:cell wall-associated NlpC family hydrolase [Actinopolymorpha pittospori]
MVRGTLALLLGASLAVTASTPVLAEPAPAPGTVPSKRQVDAARERARDAAASVGLVQAKLAGADERLRKLEVDAQAAVEVYNTAVYRRTRAEQAAGEAAARAEAARREAEQKRQAVAALAAADYRLDSRLNEISAYLGADGPRTLLDQASTAMMVSTSAVDAYQSLLASRSVARALDAEAAQYVETERRRADDAAKAKQQAATAMDGQSKAVIAIRAEKSALITRLAQLQRISTRLAAKRQAGLEAQARARAEAARQRAERERQDAERRDRDRQGDGSGGDGGGGGGSPRNDGDGTSTQQGREVVSYAMAQLGEPYVFGADGPGSWDCSGLTMKAWARAGVSMPHFARGQYWQSTPIRTGDLQPGDLLFWANNPRDSNTIYHVALYLGDGKMVHAPRPGRSVEVKSMWYMGAPTHLARPR